MGYSGSYWIKIMLNVFLRFFGFSVMKSCFGCWCVFFFVFVIVFFCSIFEIVLMFDVDVINIDFYNE